MKRILFVLLSACLFCSLVVASPQSTDTQGPSVQDRGIDPVWFPLCSDRQAWSNVTVRDDWKRRVDSALRDGVPAFSETTYREFSKTGQRQAGDRMQSERLLLLRALVLTECSEWTGRLLPQIANLLQSLATQASWTLPAHDPRLNVLEGRAPHVDLHAAELAGDLAAVRYLLSDRLDVSLQQLLLQQLRNRVVAPFLASVDSSEKIGGHWWLRKASNWNAVCLSGVVSAAMFMNLPMQEQSRVAQAARLHIRYFEDSFLDDGYALEGLGYWAYGVSRYLILREVLLRWPSAGADIIRGERQVAILSWPQRFALTGNLYPPYGDSRRQASVVPGIKAYLQQARSDIKPVSTFALPGASPQPAETLPGILFGLFARPTPLPVTSDASIEFLSDRNWFAAAQVYVGRNRGASAGAATVARLPDFAVSVKGYTDSAGHSHRDAGSYVVAIDGQWVSGDPGGPMFYDGDSFSARRFSSPLFSSYGHPVPVLAGLLQKAPSGGDQDRQLLPVTTVFESGLDRLQLELQSTYPLTDDAKLVRSVRFTRGASPMFEVTDEWESARAVSFEVPVITALPLREIKPHRLYEIPVSQGTVSLEVQATFLMNMQSEEINANGTRFVRTSFSSRSPSNKGSVTVRYRR